MKNTRTWALLTGIGGYLILRRLGVRSGASDDEVNDSLPGDDIIPHPMVETTHAATIHAPPSVVWQWLVQCGYRGAGRAGWYTDSPIDPLLERFVFRSTVPHELQPDESWLHSVDRILPEFQQTAVGDIIPDGPPGSAWFMVKAVEPECAWVLYSDSYPKYLTPRLLHETSLESYGEFTWAFILHPVEPDSTRLILRTRMRYGPPLVRRLLLPVMYAGEAIFPRLLLNGLQKRAEKSVEETDEVVQLSRHDSIISNPTPTTATAVIEGG